MVALALPCWVIVTDAAVKGVVVTVCGIRVSLPQAAAPRMRSAAALTEPINVRARRMAAS
jgi:hypothetical protein